MEIRFLKTAIKTALLDFGFKSRGLSYQLALNDLVLIVSLRKSTHGNYYYLDCGILFKALSSDLAPKASDCHIQFNFNVLAETSVPLVVKALDLDSAKNDDVASLVTLMKEKSLPKFLGMSSLVSLRDMYRCDRLKGVLILKQARELLEI